MKKLLLIFAVFTGLISFGQDYAYIDFGGSSHTSSGNWNNIVVSDQNETGVTTTLINDAGVSMGITFTLTDSFDHINGNGTTSPNSGLPFVSSASRDSFFGATDAGFNGNINATGGFTLSNLDPNKYYSFSVFSSRTGVSDNRETLYTVTGSTTDSEALNPANNTSNTATILNIQPNSNGEINFTAKPGPNNNNGFGFYYLGAIQLIESSSPISNTDPDPELTLTYPNGGHIWEAGKTVRIKWESISVPNMLVEFSSDNGSSWSTIATAPGNTQYYDMIVPNKITTNALVRISGEGETDTSDNTFKVIADKGEVFKIVILGSSTAAGTGPSDANNAWVARYNTYLTEMDTRYEVVNLAQGGFATYNILPTGTTIPAGVNRTVNTNKNITKAISLDPTAIIINLPSNDAASGYPVADQVSNYNLIANAAATENSMLWVTTPQPRDFALGSNNLAIQLAMVDETYTLFGNHTIDFWTGFGNANNNAILPAYDVDGVHMNDAAHEILFQRVIGMDIHTQVKNAVLDIENFISSHSIKLYPNPASNFCTIESDQFTGNEIKLEIFDILGKKVFTNTLNLTNQKATWSRGNLENGIYFLSIINHNKQLTKRLILN